ncbi:MAG TPA: hypothetical protein VGC55_18110 [Dokdonella sp.]
MVDDRPEPTGPLDPNRPRRAPPTIDLPASEVTSATSGPPAPEPVEEPAAAEMPEETAAESIADPVLPDEPAPPRASRPSILIPAASGAVAAALVLGAAWFAGWPGSTAPEPADTAALDALTARVARLEARPAAPASAVAAPDPATATRLDALEKSQAALRSDLAAAKTQSATAAAAVTELKSAPSVAAVDLSPITERLGQVERAAGALKTEAAQQSAKPADDKPLRRVVAASLLDGTVRQGDPYAAALAAAKPLADDADRLKPLDVFAATGVPTTAALGRDLLALLPKLALAAEPVATTGSIVDRLQAGAARLIRIERTDAVAGDDRGAVASRAAAAARRGDIAEAKRELMTLPPADRATVQPWIDRVDAREAALSASRQFAADAMAALSKPAP